MTNIDKAGGRIAATYRPTSALILDPKNPRHHDRRQIRQIARSIEAFGFIVPVLIDTDQKVIAGHGRVLASRELGLSEVPTIQLAHLTEAQARAFMIADNRLMETSNWDDRLARRTTEGTIRARPRLQPRGHRFHDGRDRSADRGLIGGSSDARTRPMRSRSSDGPAVSRARRPLDTRPSQGALRRCPR